jgi:hypothetical protein
VRFFLGAHQPHWLRLADFPLFVSHRRLAKYQRLPRAACDWALDSGGFSELALYGKWKTTEAEYIDAVNRYDTGIGRLAWAAPMDWMCEPQMLEKTGLSVAEHQYRTVENFLELCEEIPVIPVLQGWTLDDYLHCTELYAQAGVNLAVEPVVGVGSVCRRQNTAEAELIFSELADMGLRLHGFGVKTTGLARFGDRLVSSDSMSWSYDARRAAPLPGHGHRNCANCLDYAATWRARVVGPC